MIFGRSVYNAAKSVVVIPILLSFMLLTILTVAPPTTEAAPLDDFVIPKPIANPRTPDEEFFNIRLKYFLPETEPLIKTTFGNALRFESNAFWEYNSIYSRAVSFATNLPTLAKIEYGLTTNYGMSTAQSESYYYQHLLYLKGLQPGTKYNYRIKVKGSDGQLLISPNYTFTTLTLTQDIIRIPQDLPIRSFPLFLTSDDKKYVLTQDIHAPNGAIVIRANNAELDLGGHTIVYDNEPNRNITEYSMSNEYASYGIRSGWSNFRNPKVFNGTVKQGANGGDATDGGGYYPIMSTHIFFGMEVAGVTVDYYGAEVGGIQAEIASKIHHNVVYDRGHVVHNRHALLSAISTSDPRYPTDVAAYNSIRRCRQVGIRTGGDKYGNEVYGDSYAPNSQLVIVTNDSVIHNNKIFGIGYNPQGIAGDFMSNTVTESNFVYLHAWAPNQRDEEYDRLSVAIGFRPVMMDSEIYRGGPINNNLFVNNVVVVKAWADRCFMSGISTPSSKYSTNLVIRKNIVKAQTMFDYIDERELGYSVACIDTNGGGEEALPEVLFEDNRFITNVHHINIGENRGLGRNLSFYRNTFEKINQNDRHFAPVRLGYWILSTFDNKLIDSITGPGVDLSLPPKNNTYYNDVYLNLDVGVSSNRAYVDATTGAMLANRAIAYRLDGGDQGTFVTDGRGEAYREWITTKNSFKPGDPVRTMPQTHNRTVTFTTAGYEPLTMNIANIQGTGLPIRFVSSGSPPASIVAENFRGSPYLDANTLMMSFWSYSAFDGAQIYRSDSLDSVYQLIKTENGTPPYYDRGLKPNTTYYYKVRLFKGNNFGPLSEAIALKTSDIIVEGLRGAPYIDAYTLMMNFWCYSAFNGAQIYRSNLSNGTFQLIKTENGMPPYYDIGLKPNTTYYYKVRLFQGTNFGSLSEAIALKTDDIIAILNGGRATTNSIEFAWWSISAWNHAEIFRSETGRDNDFTLYAYAYTSPFYDTGVVRGKTYYYKTRLVKDGHVGPFSDVVRFTVQ
jgi:hypothetical protein